MPLSRFVEDWNATSVEFKFDSNMATRLAARGHKVAPTTWGAITQARIVFRFVSKRLFAFHIA